MWHRGSQLTIRDHRAEYLHSWHKIMCKKSNILRVVLKNKEMIAKVFHMQT